MQTEPNEQLMAAMVFALEAMNAAGKNSYGAMNITGAHLTFKAEIYLEVVEDLRKESSGTVFEWALSPGLVKLAAKIIIKDASKSDFPTSAEFAKACKEAWKSKMSVIGREVAPGMLGCATVQKSEPLEVQNKALDGVVPKALEANNLLQKKLGIAVPEQPLTEEQVEAKKRLGIPLDGETWSD